MESKLLDDTDTVLLTQLERDGRATWADLAETTGLTAPAVAQRVRRLQDRGVVTGFGARLDRRALGEQIAEVGVRLADPDRRAEFEARVVADPNVLSCERVAGEEDYWLRVRAGSASAMVAATDRLLAGSGAERTRTLLVLGTVKAE